MGGQVAFGKNLRGRLIDGLTLLEYCPVIGVEGWCLVGH